MVFNDYTPHPLMTSNALPNWWMVEQLILTQLARLLEENCLVQNKTSSPNAVNTLPNIRVYASINGWRTQQFCLFCKTWLVVRTSSLSSSCLDLFRSITNLFLASDRDSAKQDLALKNSLLYLATTHKSHSCLAFPRKNGVNNISYIFGFPLPNTSKVFSSFCKPII